ncbi:MAG: hypothetical protein H6R19_1358 [Proteobacteria bacterium]|nr:hypothetical protein [Pseudomonadota bacterium]
MTPLQALLAFIALCLLCLLLPLLPLLRTLWRGTPRPAPPEQQAEASERVEEFRRMVHEQFAHLLHLARDSGPIRGANENGRPFIVLGISNHLAELLPPGSRRLRSLVLAAGHLDIPGELICDRELFAEGRINVAHNALIKSALSQRDIAIGRRARVTRWVRTERRLDVAEGGQLKGWASAAMEIALARRARFEQLRAPRIVFGRLPEDARRPRQPDTVARFDPPLRRNGQPGNGRNLTVPAGHTVKADLLVSGKLVVGDGCRIIGDLRADKSIVIGRDVVIEGAAYADGPISIGPGCLINGPVYSRSEVQLGAASEIGSSTHLSTLVADTLLISEGCIAHGSVWALHHGEVLDERSPPA